MSPPVPTSHPLAGASRTTVQCDHPATYNHPHPSNSYGQPTALLRLSEHPHPWAIQAMWGECSLGQNTPGSGGWWGMSGPLLLQAFSYNSSIHVHAKEKGDRACAAIRKLTLSSIPPHSRGLNHCNSSSVSVSPFSIQVGEIGSVYPASRLLWQ